MTPADRQDLVEAMRALRAGANGLRARLRGIHKAAPYQQTKTKAERLDHHADVISRAIDELEGHASDHPSQWTFCRRCGGRKANEPGKL